VPRNFAFTESTIDYTNYLTNSLNPILTALADLKAKVEINVYANAVGRSSILNSILLLFSNLRLLRTNKEDTREVRQHLINALLDGDSYKIDPENPNRLILSENTTVNQNEQLDTPMVGGLYRVDGAVFRDKIDFETAMQCKDLYRPTTYEELIQNQKDANRSEYLMYHCSLSERLQSITPEEMDRKDSPHIGCHLAMTEEEQEVYFEADSNGDKDTMSRIELQARDRWSSFRKSA